jgi:hypothetical protein
VRAVFAVAGLEVIDGFIVEMIASRGFGRFGSDCGSFVVGEMRRLDQAN